MGKNRKKTARKQAPVQSVLPNRQLWLWIALGIVMIFTVAVRIRLLSVPLERDEGEFAYMGQLMLQGIPPYEIAFNMKMPGTYAAYALIMAVFGQTVEGIRIGMLLVNLAGILMVFLLGRRLFDGLTGLIAAVAYAMMTVVPYFLGFAGHATHFVVLFALGGTLLMLDAIESQKLIYSFLSGLLMGLCFIAKQQGAFLGAFAGLFILWSGLRTPVERGRLALKIALYICGSALPFGIVCLWLKSAGVFDQFWLWVFSYAREYVSELSLAQGLHFLGVAVSRTISHCILIWALSGIGLILLFWDKTSRPRAAFMAGFLAFGFFGVCPGFYFREHYWIIMMPSVSILAGLAIVSGRRLLKPAIGSLWSWIVPVSMLLISLWTPISSSSDFLFAATPVQASRMAYGMSPFPEAVEIAKYIKSHSSPNDRVLVLGSEPEVYFYSGRKSATGHIYMYGLTEKQPFAHKMQTEMTRQAEAARPRYVVLAMIRSSWISGTGDPIPVIQWFNDYAAKNLKAIGVADMISSDATSYIWGSEAATYRPKSEKAYLVLLERRGVAEN